MGHPVLRAPARALSPRDVQSPRIQQLIDDMFETMVEYGGVGLAAPQVHEGLRLFVAGSSVDDDDDEGSAVGVATMALINPEITAVGSETVAYWEGCLSIPDIRGRVPRAKDIIVRALDRDGKRVEMRASGFTARVLQHETDHLDGILFFDRMTSFETLTYLEEFGRYWSAHEVAAE
jgi:peptide deformylase